MNHNNFYTFLNRQIPVMSGLSLFPGLGYIFLSWMHGVQLPAIIWYGAQILVAIWGYSIYRCYLNKDMSKRRLERWYREISAYMYLVFSLWAVIFLIYVSQDAYKLHYIAIFTEIGASVVASTLLVSDKKLFRPIILVLMVPLILYFFSIGEWYSYVLTVFAGVFTWVLLYAANSSNRLLMKTSHQASHDLLTGLHNRFYIIGFLQQMMNSLRESRCYSYLLLIDLDHFKTINDSLGHDIGDKLLQQVASRLQDNLPEGNMLARLGGDEFIIAGTEYEDRQLCESQAIILSETIIAALKEIYIVEQHHLYISCSIGVSLVTAKSQNANTFIKEADIAMYEVKAQGRDGVFLFSDEMSKRVESHLQIERRLHFALERRQVVLNFQPQVNQDARIVGAEALVRWHSDILGDVSPVDFIPIAEQTGLIIELGNFILQSAFATLKQWHQQGIELEQLSINISMRQFFHYSFGDEVERLVETYLTPELTSKIVFELTETIVAEDITRVIALMQRLRRLGIRFSLDDFGTGYSSLSYLKQLPIEEIKIDRAFVDKLGSDESDREMINAILNIAGFFKLSVVAEGVETDRQFSILRQHNCGLFQGFYFSRPLSQNAFEELYRSNHSQIVTDRA